MDEQGKVLAEMDRFIASALAPPVNGYGAELANAGQFIEMSNAAYATEQARISADAAPSSRRDEDGPCRLPTRRASSAENRRPGAVRSTCKPNDRR
jgi:hypothetical protein